MERPEARKLYCQGRCGQYAPFVVGCLVVCLDDIPWALRETRGEPVLRLADGFRVEQDVTAPR